MPWELIEAGDREAAETHSSPPDYPAPAAGWQLSGSNFVPRELSSRLSELHLTMFADEADIFDESDEVCVTHLHSYQRLYHILMRSCT